MLEATVEHLDAQKQKSQLLPRVLNGETTLQQEVKDLFPYFSRYGFIKYLAGYFGLPEPKDNHDRDLEDIRRILDVDSLEGEVDFNALTAERLEKRLKRSLRERTVPVAAASLLCLLAGANMYAHMAPEISSPTAEIFCFAPPLIGVSVIAYIIAIDMGTYVPESYEQLEERAKQMDQFIKTHYRSS